MKLTKKWTALAGVMIAGGLVTMFCLLPEKGLSLVAREVVPVYGTQSEAMAVPAPQAIAELSAQQAVPVERCIDVKHYLIYRVQLPDGRRGFVNSGEYALMRDGKAAVC